MERRPRVLVIDDDAAMREMVVSMLDCAGFEAKTFSIGQLREAVSAALARKAAATAPS